MNIGTRTYRAVIADLDSVLTRMAQLHERAWKQTFDDYLRGRQKQGENHEPFSHAEYRAYLDGRLRYQGTAGFLEARGIRLPYGDPGDGPVVESVCGLGNRKEQTLRGLLEREGVAVYEDALAALKRWHLGGLRLAAVSASCNCRSVLRLVELETYLDVIVDGELAWELGLDNKQSLLLEAARRLDVPPEDTLVLEDAVAGVRAAKSRGFGMVVGINRNHHGAELENAGADRVLPGVAPLRFNRPVAATSAHRESILNGDRDIARAMFIDFDTCLAPAGAGDPVAEELQSALAALSGQCTVGLLSGRDRERFQRQVQVDGLHYAGDSGLDVAGPGYQCSQPQAEQSLADLDSAEERLRRAIESIQGVFIERTRFALALTFQGVASEVAVQQIRRVVDAVLADTALAKRDDDRDLYLVPRVAWDKVQGLEYLLETTETDSEQDRVIYVGSGDEDEPVFAHFSGRAVCLTLGDAVSDTLADFQLADRAELRDFLRAAAQVSGRSG